MKNWGFLEYLKAVQEKVLSFSVWALQIYHFGHLRYKFQTKFIHYPLAFIHIVLKKLGEILFGVTIGVSAKIGKRFTIEYSGSIVIHGNTQIGANTVVIKDVPAIAVGVPAHIRFPKQTPQATEQTHE